MGFSDKRRGWIILYCIGRIISYRLDWIVSYRPDRIVSAVPYQETLDFMRRLVTGWIVRMGSDGLDEMLVGRGLDETEVSGRPERERHHWLLRGGRAVGSDGRHQLRRRRKGRGVFVFGEAR